MSSRTSPWPPGVPCWADLTVPDPAAAKQFYAAVLGWTFQDFGPELGHYSIARAGGRAAAGIGPLPAADQPSAWTLSFASADADATAAAVTAAGGELLLPPGDVGSLGRMFVAADPSGAAFGVWQPGEHIGAGVVNEPGALTWEDLRSTDPDAARAFYAAVFGFETTPLPGAGGDYRTFALPAEPAPLGGMGGMTGQDGSPSHWLTYWGVADVDAAVTAAGPAGGSVLAAGRDSPFGRMAALADPAGATFWIIAPPEGMAGPDRGE